MYLLPFIIFLVSQNVAHSEWVRKELFPKVLQWYAIIFHQQPLRHPFIPHLWHLLTQQRLWYRQHYLQMRRILPLLPVTDILFSVFVRVSVCMHVCVNLGKCLWLCWSYRLPFHQVKRRNSQFKSVGCLESHLILNLVLLSNTCSHMVSSVYQHITIKFSYLIDFSVHIKEQKGKETPGGSVLRHNEAVIGQHFGV